MSRSPVHRRIALLTLTGALAACAGGDDGQHPDDGSGASGSTTARGDTSVPTETATPPPDTDTDTSTQTSPAPQEDGGTTLGGAELEQLDVTVTAPREVVTLGDGTLLIADQAGLVHVVEPDGNQRAEPMLNLAADINTPSQRALEAGLAGFALAPDFPESGHVYTTTTHSIKTVDAELPTGTRQVNILSRWTADPQTITVDTSSEEQLLVLPSRDEDHVGGEIVFDDEGLLYTSLGAPSRDAAAQDPLNYAGSVLRIDPTPEPGQEHQDRAYGIPQDNPFADGQEGLPEVYSYGYRNPWRLTWDTDHGLLVGEAMANDKHQQVGQPAPGDDAGYPEVSGACWEEATLSEGCQQTEAGIAIAAPVLEYGPEIGGILSGVTTGTGGQLEGRVIVTDWEGSVLAADPGETPWEYEVLSDGSGLLDGQSYLWDVDAEPDGSLYLLTSGRRMGDGLGAVHRLVP